MVHAHSASGPQVTQALRGQGDGLGFALGWPLPSGSPQDAVVEPGRGGLRVVHLAPTFFDRDGVLGGGERYPLELARAMARLTPTALVSFAGEDRAFDVDGLQVRLVKPARYVSGHRHNPFSLRFLGVVADTDVVHCHQFRVLATSLALVAARWRGKRAYVSDLGGGSRDLSSWVDTGRWVDGFLHISQFASRGYGAYGSRNHVIYGGVDPERFRPLPIPKAARVLFVGRLLPHKGVNYLIEALDGETELRVVGRAYDPRYREELGRLAAGKLVTFLEQVDDVELAQEYSEAAVTVAPSVHRTLYGDYTPVPELLGLTVLESLACGTPVICTNVASFPELVEDGVNGFLVPPNDPGALRERIAWILNHPPEAQAMGEKGRRVVLERFTWRAVAERCLEIYRGT